jgi:hypothetical protein
MNSSTGQLNCTNANITGAITATSGTFTGTVNATSGTFNNVTVQTGSIGGFRISGNALVNNATNASIQFALTGSQFIQINNSSYSALLSVRKDGGTAISASAYGSNSTAIAAIAQAGYPTTINAIESTGSCLFTTRDTERVKIMGLCVNVVTITSSYSAKTCDDLIVCNNTNDITISLPWGTFYSGKIIYIKSINTGNWTVSGGIRNADKRETKYSSKFTDNKFRGFMYDGSYWNELFFSA